MIPVHEAQRRLIRAGFLIDMQSPFRELTILDAKYEDVKGYLREQGYEGNIVVIGKKRPTQTIEKVEGIEKYLRARKIENSARDNTTTKQRETFYEQMSLF